jgi:hypothetical protein
MSTDQRPSVTSMSSSRGQVTSAFRVCYGLPFNRPRVPPWGHKETERPLMRLRFFGLLLFRERTLLRRCPGRFSVCARRREPRDCLGAAGPVGPEAGPRRQDTQRLSAIASRCSRIQAREL